MLENRDRRDIVGVGPTHAREFCDEPGVEWSETPTPQMITEDITSM